MKERMYTVHEVLADGPGDGPAGDGTFVRRFRDWAEAASFAGRNTCYGRPCTVTTDQVSKRLAQRWGMA